MSAENKEGRAGAWGAVYARCGWVSYQNWLGIKHKPTDGYREFYTARDYVRSLNMTNKGSWLTWCRCKP